MVALTYHLARRASMYVSGSGAFRVPTLNQLYDRRPIFAGIDTVSGQPIFVSLSNAQLDPQRSRNVEIGGRWEGEDAWATMTIYSMWVEDEIDFESGFIMVPAAVPDDSAEPGAVPTGLGAQTPASVTGAGPAVPGVSTVTPGTAAAGRPSAVRLRFKATRGQIFKAFLAIANLADKSDGGVVNVNIEGTSVAGFDPLWLRNAVDEPLSEADIEREPEGA